MLCLAFLLEALLFLLCLLILRKGVLIKKNAVPTGNTLDITKLTIKSLIYLVTFGCF